jgi:hypothetical protein
MSFSRPIPVKVLREIAKDLTLGDMYKEKLRITELQLTNSNEIIFNQDQIITLLRNNETYYVQIIENSERKIAILDEYVKILKNENKQLKFKSKIKTGLLTGIIGGLTYLLIK